MDIDRNASLGENERWLFLFLFFIAVHERSIHMNQTSFLLNYMSFTQNCNNTKHEWSYIPMLISIVC